MRELAEWPSRLTELQSPSIQALPAGNPVTEIETTCRQVILIESLDQLFAWQPDRDA